MPNENDREIEQRWSDLVKKVWKNDALKRQLLEDPAKVLGEHGIDVRPGHEVRVVENTDKVAYLTLPARPKEGELSTDQLEQVVGGGVSHDSFVITKLVDAATPKLY